MSETTPFVDSVGNTAINTVGNTEKMHDLYNRERILLVLSRVRKAGGVPMEEKVMQHTASWFRSLALRGFADVSMLHDADGAKSSFRRAFPNTMTRCQYTRAITAYIGGLTDDEFATEYPGTTRAAVVKLMKDIAVDAGKEKRQSKQVDK